jgi:DNA-directed RNA polymerase beta subunit
MANNFLEKVEDVNKRIQGNPERLLGTGLVQPMANAEAGARKLMHAVHRTHILPLLNGEKAHLETGYEIRFGDLSSSVTETENNYRVVAKISKFNFSPNHHYYLLLEDTENKRLDMIERISYKPSTESYGYLYNNTIMDNIQVGQMIPSGTILQKSLAFDEHMNRKDGRNFNVAYMSLDKNMEDSIIFSDEAAKYMASPLIKPVDIMINENDIPLNLYGNDDMYKAIPDKGENIKDSILIALRKEKKEESIYTQSIERLRHCMMSDVKYTLTGKVIDVDIRCNNVPNLDNYYNSQFKMYYNELQRMSAEIVATITQYEAYNYQLSYDVQKLFANAKRVLNKDQYIEKKLFSNLMIRVVVLEERELQVGDKTSNRYGGKGVLSTILPQHLMPRFGNNEYVDVILNSNGVYGRENPGQLFELSITHIGCEILKRISMGEYTVDQAFDLIAKYIEFISASEANSLRVVLSNMNEEEKAYFLQSYLNDGAIQISAKPISESITIDTLAEMYKAFPWVKQVEIEVPIKDSNGRYRYVKARRPIIVGKQYTFRLKQYAEEKFSATSLSATNIRNENTKSKAARDYRELYSNTPIRFGNMETNDLCHLGAAYVVTNLLIHSLSPHARRLTEQMFICDPFRVDIRLDDVSSNRSAEIANVYLKTIGRRLIFNKRRKIRRKMLITPMYKTEYTTSRPMWKISEDGFDFNKDWEDRQKLYQEQKEHKAKPVFSEYGIIDTKRRKQQYNDELDLDYRKFLENRKKELKAELADNK